MRKTYHVQGLWYPEAKVWASNSDVPGLVIETATLAEFEALMRELVPEMIEGDHAKGEVVFVEWNSSGVFELALA